MQFKGLTFMIPGCKLLQSSACAKKFISGCLNFHKAVCFSLGVIRSLRPLEDWPDLQGLKNSKTHSLSYLEYCQTCCVCRQAWNFRLCPGRSEADQRPALLLLKPKQDFLHFIFPNTRAHSSSFCYCSSSSAPLTPAVLLSLKTPGPACHSYCPWLHCLE